MLPGGPAPVSVHVVPAASAFCKSADEGVATSGNSTLVLVPTTRSAPCEGPAFVRMTEPSPLQVALNSNAVGPAIGSANAARSAKPSPKACDGCSPTPRTDPLGTPTDKEHERRRVARVPARHPSCAQSLATTTCGQTGCFRPVTPPSTRSPTTDDPGVDDQVPSASTTSFVALVSNKRSSGRASSASTCCSSTASTASAAKSASSHRSPRNSTSSTSSSSPSPSRSTPARPLGG
jgi:hypothetical protein